MPFHARPGSWQAVCCGGSCYGACCGYCVLHSIGLGFTVHMNARGFLRQK